MAVESGGPRVLIVEDEADVASLIRSILEDEGYQAVCHPNGDCLQLIDSFRPDVILCDYMLPLHDGNAVLRHVRNHVSPHVPVILMSAAAFATRNWRDWGADDFLAKPFDIDRLVAMVDRAVSGDGRIWSGGAREDSADEEAS